MRSTAGRLSLPALALMAMAVASSLSSSAMAQQTDGVTPPIKLTQVAAKVQPVDVQQFTQSRFAVLSTELSPAVVVQCREQSLGLFKGLSAWGAGAPSYVAVPTKDGVRVVTSGSQIADPISEPWMLCWFKGADGWNRWDVPMLIVLQHRPTFVSLATTGLDLKFAGESGMTAVMPLYGFHKLPFTHDDDFLVKNGLPSPGISTDGWSGSLPASVVDRCRLFARMLRSVPVYCREEFAVDGDDLLVRSSFTWLPIHDDWDTQPLKIAPVSPTLALAWWCGNHGHNPFPMTFSNPIRDLDLFTPYGPYVGVENVDSYSMRMKVLQYVNFGEKPQMPAPDSASPTATVLSRLQGRMASKFKTTDMAQLWDHGGAGNFCWQIIGDRWYAKSIPYLPSDVQDRVKATLRTYLSDQVLSESTYKPFKDMLLLVGPGIATWGGYDDAGKFSANVIETVDDIAENTDAWDIVKDRWPIIKRLFITPLESDWKSVGRNAIAEMGDEGGPAIAMARLASHVGDNDTYAVACYTAARELVHHYVKQVGIDYYRIHQPWLSNDPFPSEVYLTNMLGDIASWRIDGPGYPTYDHERQSNNRWVRFSSEDVAAFYHDVLPTEVQAEMDLLMGRAKDPKAMYKLNADTAHIAPSMVRLRALLLNEPADKLAAECPPDEWAGGRSCDVAAMCVPFLRNTSPINRVRLIPAIHTDYVLGASRAVEGGYPGLDLAVESPKDGGMAGHPFLRWWGWRAPTPANGVPNGRYLSFGQITPGDYNPTSLGHQRLNWNTTITLPQ